jgi:hypothetical protein
MKKGKALSAQRAGLMEQNYYNTLSFVSKYLSLRLPIIPVTPREKTPRVAKNDTWQRKFSLAEFHEDDNIGLRCGVKWQGGYLFAIDFDSNNEEKFFKLVQTFQENGVNGIIQRSGGKHHGFHFIGKVDEPIEGSKITFEGVEIDIKGNGYVLIAPSFVSTKYQILKGNFQDLKINEREKVIKSLEKTSKKIQPKKTHTYNFNEDILNTVVGVSVNLSNNLPNVKSLLKRDGKIFLKSFDELFDTFLGWRILSEKFSLDFPLELHKSFRSIPVLHGGKKDEKPSAEFFRGKNGLIVYRDFRLNRAYTLPEVYHALKTNKAPLLKERRKKILSQWTAEMIDDLNIYTQDALDYVKALSKFIGEAIKRENMPERYVKVWRKIADKMLRAYDHGGDIFTARWLEKETGVDHLIANKALNVLVACGVLRKGEEKILIANGKKYKTQVIEPVKDFDIVDALRILSLMHENLRKRKYGWDKFSRRAVISVLGEEMAKTIFTRGRDEKEKIVEQAESVINENEQEEMERETVKSSQDGIEQRETVASNERKLKSAKKKKRRRDRSKILLKKF